MTALADITKSHLTVASLRGSDLQEFNESHPRDDSGRFTTLSGGGTKMVDPRTARMARRKRGVRRTLRAVASTPPPKEEEKAADPRALTSLLRERILPRRGAQKITQQKTQPRQAEADQDETEPQSPLNDYDLLYSEEEASRWPHPGIIPLTVDQFKQFQEKGELVVNGANKVWGGRLATTAEKDLLIPKGSADPDLVFLRISEPHFISDREKIRGNIYSNVLHPGQLIVPSWHEGPRRWNSDEFRFNSATGQRSHSPKADIKVRVVDVNLWHPTEDLFHGVDKADETWDEEEHPRDWDSGRFVSGRRSRGTLPPNGPDPRVVRMARRKRGARRSLAVITPQPETTDVRSQERILRRPSELKTHGRDRILVRRAAAALAPGLPENAEVVLQAEGGPVTRTLEERQQYYEDNGVYPGIRASLAEADWLIQEAASGRINEDSDAAEVQRVSFSQKFLSGQRTKSQYAQQIAEKDVDQAIGQLQGAQRMFRHLQAHGASQWTARVESSGEEEKKEATHIAVQPGTMASLLGHDTPIDYGDTGYGTSTIPIAEYKRAQEIKADANDAAKMHVALDVLRRNDPESYEKAVVFNLLRFTRGEASYNEAMEDTARVMGYHSAARHYRREDARESQLAARTVKTKIAAKKRSADVRVRQQSKHARSVAARQEFEALGEIAHESFDDLEAPEPTKRKLSEINKPKFTPGELERMAERAFEDSIRTRFVPSQAP